MKRDALIAPALALGAFALFYALLFPKPSLQGPAVAPLSVERGPDGLAAAAQWLRQSGIPVVSLRDRYGALARVSRPDGHNLLVATLPQRIPMQPQEQTALLQWIAQGNTLLLLAAIDDTPYWALPGGDAADAAQRLTGIGFALPGQPRSNTRPPGPAGGAARAEDSASRTAQQIASLLLPASLRIQPRGMQALMSGVHELSVRSALPTTRRRGIPADNVGALVLAQGITAPPQPPDAVLWVEPYENGQIILSAFAAPFSNAQIDAADNARLLSNIVAWSRGAQGRVIFDDAHQGLVDFYDPQAFWRDPRLHHSLEWILAVWLIWALGSQTLRSGQPLWQPTAATTLMEASANFFSARVRPPSAAQRLLQNFYDEIHRRRGESEDGTAPWHWLSAQPALAAERLAQLRELDAQVGARAPVSLARLQNLLSQIRGSIQ
jgi:hypothetical protein